METLNRIGAHGHWLVRGVLAGIFLPHGVSKFGASPEYLAEMFFGSGYIAVLVGIAEVGAAALYLAGGLRLDWATRVAGLLSGMVMLGAILTVHWGRWSFMAQLPDYPIGGMQFQTLILALSVWFLCAGNRQSDRTPRQTP